MGDEVFIVDIQRMENSLSNTINIKDLMKLGCPPTGYFKSITEKNKLSPDFTVAIKRGDPDLFWNIVREAIAYESMNDSVISLFLWGGPRKIPDKSLYYIPIVKYLGIDNLILFSVHCLKGEDMKRMMGYPEYKIPPLTRNRAIISVLKHRDKYRKLVGSLYGDEFLSMLYIPNLSFRRKK